MELLLCRELLGVVAVVDEVAVVSVVPLVLVVGVDYS